MSDARRHASLDEVEVAFARECETDKRAAAEIAYALAVRYRNQDIEGRRRFDLAKVWAIRCIDLLDALPSDRLDQVASTATWIAGVPIPELLHSDLVRQRLADVLI